MTHIATIKEALEDADPCEKIDRAQEALTALQEERKEMVEALENLMRRLDDHFGGIGKSYDWK